MADLTDGFTMTIRNQKMAVVVGKTVHTVTGADTTGFAANYIHDDVGAIGRHVSAIVVGQTVLAT